SICFVGYCDPDTPGGALLKTNQGEDFVFKTLDYIAKVRATVEKFDLTGHAEREELFDFAIKANPRAIILTHGDPSARDWFIKTFANTSPQIKVVNPIPEKESFV